MYRSSRLLTYNYTNSATRGKCSDCPWGVYHRHKRAGPVFYLCSRHQPTWNRCVILAVCYRVQKVMLPVLCSLISSVRSAAYRLPRARYLYRLKNGVTTHDVTTTSMWYWREVGHLPMNTLHSLGIPSFRLVIFSGPGLCMHPSRSNPGIDPGRYGPEYFSRPEIIAPLSQPRLKLVAFRFAEPSTQQGPWSQ